MFAASKTAKAASAAAATDPQFNYVTMLLHGDGTNGAQNNTFVDSSTNNFTITRNGNTTQGTFTPYGSNFSNYFGGSADYLSTPASANMNIGTGDFTYETWVFPTSFSSARALISFANTNVFYLNTSGIPYYGIYLVSDTAIGSTAVALNTWSHLAFVRSGTTLTCYINGTSVGSITTASSIGSSILTNYIGYHQGGNYWAGYLSNARVVKGTAVYTGSFTPSTTPLTAISGTSLLTCQSNRFIDNSTNAFTITVNGSPSVQRFSPFSPTSAYSTSVIGGSGYFDGATDYLTAASNAALTPGSSNFTYECWIYPTAYDGSGSGNIIWSGSVSNAPILYYNGSNGNITFRDFNTADIVSTTAPPIGAWCHIAVSRSGSTIYLFKNGVLATSATYSVTFAQSTTYIGWDGTDAGYEWIGYISDARFVKGTALYTATFTPPTAPLTAVSNTQLLLNFTNAGILDNAMMNDLETVGNAQISTSVYKYGTGSISMTSSGDYCKGSQPSIVDDIAGGNFTIEFWVYFTSLAADRALISKYGNSAETAGGLGYVLQWVQSSSVLRLVLGVGGGSDALYTWSWAPSTSTWYHVAVTRSGTSGRAFINGTQIGTTSTLSTSDVASPNVIQLGKTHTVAQYLLGYMDDVRITKGYARYTSNFTAPTAAFPNN